MALDVRTNLHSTMYLLKRIIEYHQLISFIFTFHYVSIKTSGAVGTVTSVATFTFHYVSIKTLLSAVYLELYSHLHSTMYLLKPQSIWLSQIMLYLFTFHYVSIKTRIEVYSRCFFYNLHSTMYLLKRYTIYWQFANDTNLHSTMYLLKLNVMFPRIFTMQIYIPLCIY